MKSEELIPLMQQMADLTRPECGKCRVPLSCCAPEYCQMAIEYAEEDWGVELKTTEHPRLPLMGSNGCTAPPHLRPLCTLHTCRMSGIGSSGNPAWDVQYLELREKINEVEFPSG